jgi:TPR repeat protein
MVNRGRFLKEGRGGLARNPEAAVALYQKAVLRGDNPWAKVALAEALETGEGAPKNVAEARALYQAAIEQDAEPDARKRAEEALARLRKR